MCKINETSIDTLCAALAYSMGIDAPEHAASKNSELSSYVDKVLNGKKVDRILMFNPDAISQWVYEKYPQFFKELTDRVDIHIPFCTVMPSVTPVCFGTIYTGAQPSVHGIQRYEKPVIKIDTLFDALIRAGKKPAIVATHNCSIGNIFLERDMDYYLYNNSDDVLAKTAELIIKDKYDFIVCYIGSYDTVMHKHGPESIEALGELRYNVRAYSMLDSLVKEHWKNHRSLIGFAMDHGAHEIDGGCGSHGLDMPEDLNIVHHYKIHS